ncbi:MAG: hypothetical protein IMHGJWDQ_000831 [Candidatus Fervidibacter sp.]
MVLVQRLVDFALFVLCVLAIVSVGAAALRRLALFGLSRLEQVTLSLGLGALVVAYSILLFGFLGWLHRTVFYLWLGFCYAVGATELVRLWRAKHFPPPFSEAWGDLTRTERCWVWWLVALNLLAMVLCFVPPWQFEWDSLSYHLAVPKLYWMEGRIHYIAFSHHAQFPMTAQMLYLLGLGLTNLKSAAVAKLFHWLFFVLCQLTLLSWGVAVSGRSFQLGITAAVLFASLPLAFTEAVTAYVDLATTAFGLLCLFCLCRYHHQPDGRWLLLSGLFAGATAGTKYTGLLLLPLLVLFSLWAMKRIGERHWFALVVSALAALAIAAPWYVKNWLWTKNPVFPFAYGIFGGRNWSAEMALTYTLSNREFGGSRDLLALLSLPFNLSLNEVRFGRCAREWMGRCPQRRTCRMRWKCGKFDNQDVPSLTIGILPLALAPTAIVAAIGEGIPFAVTLPTLTMLAWFVWWFWEVQYLRYLLPALGCLAVLLGWGVSRLVGRGLLTTVIVRVTITVGLGYALLVAVWQAAPLLPVAIGLVPDEEFLRETTPIYRVAEFVNSALPRRSVIATYGVPLGYYFERRYFWADSGHNRLIRYERLQGVRDLVREWERLQVSHVIIDWAFVPRESELGRWIEEGKAQGLVETVWEEGSREVLEVARRRKP